MPTRKQLSLMRESENEYPEIRRTDDPGYKSPSTKNKSEMPKSQEIKEGDTVEHIQVGNKKIRTTVLKVKADGNLILDTRRGPGKKGTLCKNVCVKPHRVTKV